MTKRRSKQIRNWLEARDASDALHVRGDCQIAVEDQDELSVDELLELLEAWDDLNRNR